MLSDAIEIIDDYAELILFHTIHRGLKITQNHTEPNGCESDSATHLSATSSGNVDRLSPTEISKTLLTPGLLYNQGITLPVRSCFEGIISMIM